MQEAQLFKEEEIQAVISESKIDTPEKEFAHFFIFLILMPLSGSLSLGILTYFLQETPLGFVTAFFFLFSFCGWITLWVLKHLQELRKNYEKAINTICQAHHPKRREELRKKAIAVLTKSSVLYVLILGYLGIAFGFSLVYDALNLTTEIGFWNNLYFSISTITTLGYGDVVPVDYGRFFACFQMIYGILYQVLAVSVGTTYLIQITRRNAPI